MTVVVAVTVMVVMIPIAFRMPPVVGAAPVAVVFIPTTLPFGIQVPAAALCLVTALSMMADGVIKPHLCLLDATLAFSVIVVCMKTGRCAEKQGGRQNSGRQHSGRNAGPFAWNAHRLPPVAKWQTATFGQNKDPASGESRSIFSPGAGPAPLRLQSDYG
jgi:hypothetical protein